MDQASNSFPPSLEIRTTFGAGRSYHSTRSCPSDACILDISTPYSYTIYKQFRNEVCSECFRYDSGRRTFITQRQHGEDAGLHFCDDKCQAAWLDREGPEAIQMLRILEESRRRKPEKEAQSQGELTSPKPDITDSQIEQAWKTVLDNESNPKERKKWSRIQLDDFEADLARYVLLALLHLAQELCHHSTSHEEPSTNVPESSSAKEQSPDRGHILFGGATWTSLAALQTNEVHQIKLFPELLENHIRLYQVVKGLFGGKSCSKTRRVDAPRNPGEVNGAENSRLLWDYLQQVITVGNVRTALGVDAGNSFGIWETPVTDESELLGFAVYPIPSFFNHRKSANCQFISMLTTPKIQTVLPICARTGLDGR
ncbi:hypothetical protein C8Q75DRAFT_768136 [Abortiporus biennis]|nr:hypothetical protein C8Q75DRAFT_768136 [Abortiporus biennis]